MVKEDKNGRDHIFRDKIDRDKIYRDNSTRENDILRNDLPDETEIRGAAVDTTDILPKDSRWKVSEPDEKFRLVFQQNPLGVFHFDVNGTVTDCNDRMIEIWGSSREKFIGFNLLSSLKNKKMKIAVKTCLTGRHACYEGHYLSVTGGRIANLKANYGPISSTDGTVIGGIAVIEDLAESKGTEDAFHESESPFRLLYSHLLAAQEKERTQIARELNDSVAYSLSSIKFSLESALEHARTSRFDPELFIPVITKMQHVMEESRRITTDLRPAILDELGIVSTVRWFTDRYREDHPDVWVKTELSVEEDRIPDRLKTAIFRVVQDYFREIAAGPEGRAVGVALGKTDEAIYLEIDDNCLGYEPVISTAGKIGERMGLLGIRGRVELAGGRMKVESREGGGSVLRTYWPFPNGQGTEDQWGGASESFSRG